MGQESRRVEWEQLVIRRISAGWSSCCGNPNLAGDGADEWVGSLCVAQGYSGEIANLAKLQIGRIASAGQSSDNRQPTPYQCFPNSIGVTGLVAYRTLTIHLQLHRIQALELGWPLQVGHDRGRSASGRQDDGNGGHHRCDVCARVRPRRHRHRVYL